MNATCPRCDTDVIDAEPGQRVDCWYCHHVYHVPAHTHPTFIVWASDCPACVEDDPDASKALDGFVRVFDIDIPDRADP